MEDKLEKILLYETYKEMLTLNMQDVFEQYYYSDLSLREIGENNNISFQAVRDALKKAEKTLTELEEKLQVVKLKNEITELQEYISTDNMDIEELKNKIRGLGEN
ncbi:MAG: hypothetical protein IKK84_00540 [Clostridia bacterium]|nr:hypothetical protein [Clostridia bacterium]MBR6641139.1 hypothetical protein [Clostridia bacterium]